MRGAARFQAALADHRAGRLAVALVGYDAVLAADPDCVDALVNRGIVLIGLGDVAAGQLALERAAGLAPGRGDIAWNLGLALARLGRATAALAALDQAVALGCAVAGRDRQRGDLLLALGRDAEAAAAFERHLTAAPDDAATWSRLGIARHRMGAVAPALAALRQAVTLAPDFGAAWHNLGEVLRADGQFVAARDALARAIALGGDNAARCQWLHVRAHLADWDGFAADRDAFLADVAAGRARAVPFSLLGLTDDPALHLAAARAWLAGHDWQAAPPLPPAPEGRSAAAPARLRIAYVSGDFHDHASMHLIADVLAAHDRQRFEITLLSIGPAIDDVWRRQAVAAADRFIEAGERGDGDLAALLRELGIDLAIDLRGATAGSRPGIFAARAAPVQAGWMGYPGSMPGLDYLIADAVVVPDVERRHIAEAVVRLPFGYQPNCRLAPLPLPGRRADEGLPEHGFVFASFNRLWKITPEAFAGWLAILRAVPDSVLWLWADDAGAQARLRARAVADGAPPERLVFAASRRREAHLARLQHADLLLDSGPYGAHTTASDALRAGVPVLTCPGRSFASRVAASLLTTLDLPELIAVDAADYHAKAVRLATEPTALAAVKARLAAALATSPLYDPDRFCRALEAAFAAMIARSRAGLAPADMDIGPLVRGPAAAQP